MMVGINRGVPQYGCNAKFLDPITRFAARSLLIQLIFSMLFKLRNGLNLLQIKFKKQMVTDIDITCGLHFDSNSVKSARANCQ